MNCGDVEWMRRYAARLVAVTKALKEVFIGLKNNRESDMEVSFLLPLQFP